MLQQRGDVTVDATLRAGDIKETVTVTGGGQRRSVQYRKAGDHGRQRMTNSVPQLYRTPFLLAQLDPAVEKSDSQTEYMPYHSWGPNTQRVGGGQNLYC